MNGPHLRGAPLYGYGIRHECHLSVTNSEEVDKWRAEASKLTELAVQHALEGIWWNWSCYGGNSPTSFVLTGARKPELKLCYVTDSLEGGVDVHVFTLLGSPRCEDKASPLSGTCSEMLRKAMLLVGQLALRRWGAALCVCPDGCLKGCGGAVLDLAVLQAPTELWEVQLDVRCCGEDEVRWAAPAPFSAVLPPPPPPP
eukprot:Sspe_Gene.62912::Locus_35634_Transcript_1_1_Confidence_1.000_Length_637::g.62912::m.62912